MSQIELKQKLETYARVSENEPLSAHTGFRTGGTARLAVFPDDVAAFVSVVGLIREAGVRHFILGGGRNVLATDAGYDGVIVFTGGLRDIRIADDTKIFCEAGVALRDLCIFAADHGLSGLEFAYGIPGTVGGAVYMNAGAYGGEIGDVIETVGALLPDGRITDIPAKDCGFGYRTSRFQKTPGAAVLHATFALSSGDGAEIRAKMDDIMARRVEKQPLEYPSCGSTFRRPEGAYASELIDRCGLKGLSAGGAAVSGKHAGFIVNTGDATSADILRLIGDVRDRVLNETGTLLETEVVILE